MKKTIAAMLTTISAAAIALDADYTEGEHSADLITPSIEAAAGQLLGTEQASNLLRAVRLNMAVYDADMTTENGRRRWHGRHIREDVDTNACEIVHTYSNAVDGAVWRYKSAMKVKRPPSVESRLSAERKRQIAAAAAERRRLDRIEAITTNETAEVAKIMKSKGYPEDLARLMLMWELSQLNSTGVVTTVITPQP